MPAGSVIFVITSWSNTQMTVEVAEFCRKIGHRIILLTNGDTCPIAAHADLVLALPGFSGQYTIAPYILIADALTKEIGMRLRPESLKRKRKPAKARLRLRWLALRSAQIPHSAP